MLIRVVKSIPMHNNKIVSQKLKQTDKFAVLSRLTPAIHFCAL